VELYLPSPNTPSWRGARLKKAEGLYLKQLYVITEYIFSIPFGGDNNLFELGM